jgi:hypothetical protein
MIIDCWQQITLKRQFNSAQWQRPGLMRTTSHQRPVAA